MKKLIFLILLFSSIKVISQVNYPNAKQHLKEFIAIQSLLAENRMEDLKTFCINYNYLAEASNDEIRLIKSMDVEYKENDIIAVITLKSGGENLVSYNYIEIFFMRDQNRKTSIFFSLDECKSIENIIQNTYEIGTQYNIVKSITDSAIKNEEFNVEEFNRYNFIVSPIKNPDEKIYLKASNFFRNQFIEGNPLCFAGPGKNLGIIIDYLEPIKHKVEEKYAYKMRISSFKLPDDVSKGNLEIEKFNVDFFMSLKNFNDRIWLDR
jgi:hypothetical protein